jgi:hypothetical protein
MVTRRPKTYEKEPMRTEKKRETQKRRDAMMKRLVTPWYVIQTIK